MSLCLLDFEVGDEDLVVVQAGLADRQQPFCQSLAVLEQEEVLVLHAVEQRQDVLHLLLKLLLLHLQLQPSVSVNGQQLLDRHWQLRVDEGLLYAALVI